jgi:hypothetical protein
VRRRRGRGAAAALLIACACTSSPQSEATAKGDNTTVSTGPMREILESHPGLAPIVARASELRLQAVLGTIEPGPDGRPRLVQHGFRLGAEYFYPASTVKLFAAVAALERLGEIARTTGLDVGPDTPMVFHPLFAGEEREESDPTNLDGGKITVRHEIRKLFLVSDNAAFNRLYELVGQDGLAASMRRAGLRESRIVHRLSEAHSAEENRRYPRIDLVGADFVHTLPERSSEPLAAPAVAPPKRLEVGTAYLADGDRVEGPMDFSTKNYVPLAELQRGLCKAVHPDVDCGGGEPFAISDADRALLFEAMSLFPRQSKNPLYDPGEYPDEYVKFLLPGLRRALGDDGFRIYDKSGQAYGFTTENAYIVEVIVGSDTLRPGRAFFLAATIYTNADGVLNDDAYDYDTLALPFFADLAEATVRWLRLSRP